jgi:hypothetical protein
MPLFYLEALGDVLIGEDGGDGGVPGGQQRLLCLLAFTAFCFITCQFYHPNRRKKEIQVSL